MLRQSRGLPGLRAGLQRILACCGLALLFSASPSFAQSTAGLNKATQVTSTTQAAPAASSSTQVQLEGTLEVLHEDDFKSKKSRNRYFLKTDSGERYELQFKKGQPQHAPGSKVRVKGTQSGGTLMLEAGGSTSYQYLAAPDAGANTFGAQNTAVLLVNFQDQPNNKPWTLDQWRSLVFGTASGTVNDYYLKASYQQTWVTGQVYGWLTLPINSTDPCDANAIETATSNAAAAAGINLSAYTRIVVAFPSWTCSWSGLAGMGGNVSWAFINGYYELHAVAHELAHGMGLFHSHAWDCDTSPTGNTCSYYEYGSNFDIMGASTAGQFNASQKERLGWLNYGASPPITTVQADGTYTLEPYEVPGNGAKALKILKSTDPATGQKTWYYLEFRQDISFDSMLVGSNILNGVVFHTAKDGDANSSYMLDMTPGSLTGYIRADLEDPALVVGRSYTDSTAGVTITPMWANSVGAGVQVTFSQPTASCIRAKPSVVISPSLGPTVVAGTPVSYTVAVTNNDSSICGSSSFSLQASVPSGWTGAWATPSLTVGAGSSASTTLTVTSASSAVASSYSIGATATNSGNTSYSSSASATYVVGTTTSTTRTKGGGKARLR